MPNPDIEEFAKLLVQQVRDAAIRSCDRKLEAGARGPAAMRWRDLIRQGNAEAMASTLIPDVVDDTIFHLLHALDEGRLKLSFAAADGKKVDLPEDGLGELGGWYMGIPGWRSSYSQQRFVDDFSDLR
jgi:hypothetical protein